MQTLWLPKSPQAEMLRGFLTLGIQLEGEEAGGYQEMWCGFCERGRLEHHPAAGTEQRWKMWLCQADGVGSQHLTPHPVKSRVLLGMMPHHP